jgi:cellulose synthase/poly-beta-1,6-N-acetylglucosamine synthase-like glycosyltransferase
MTETDLLIVFATSVGWIGYVFVGYPALLWIIGKVRRIAPRQSERDLPRVSVLISARNEEKDIAWKIQETLDWDYPAHLLHVLVASDASDDRTDDIARSFSSDRVTLLRIETRGGKNRALNRLKSMAHGEVLFFTDANAHIGRDALRRMVRYFADARVGCVTGRSCSDLDEEASAVGHGGQVYLGYESMLGQLESRLGSVLVCDGAIFCVRTSLFCTLVPELANDLELPMHIAHAGHWVLQEPAAQVLEKETSSPWQEFARRRRISGQGALAMWRLREKFTVLRGWQFASHKLLRWLTVVPCAAVLMSSAALSASPAFMALVFAQLLLLACASCGFVMAVAGRDPGRFIATPFYFVLGITGSFIGVLDTCLGRRYAVWEIPTLARGHVAADRTERS